MDVIKPKIWMQKTWLSYVFCIQILGFLFVPLNRWQRRLRLMAWVVCSVLAILMVHSWGSLPSQAQPAPPQSPSSPESLPAPAVHPLPPDLATWHDANHSGDYFSAIQPTSAGYLVWSRFPVRVYVEPVSSDAGAGAEATAERSRQWVEGVTAAVQEWNVYLPLQVVIDQALADITIWRRVPPLLREINRPPRARSAETRYEFYTQPLDQNSRRLTHRVTVLLRPDQTAAYTRAAARHELGHALGIWGHSPVPTDALYFSQVRTPPAISSRDINTLKRIYEQPTRLGWLIQNSLNSSFKFMYSNRYNSRDHLAKLATTVTSSAGSTGFGMCS